MQLPGKPAGEPPAAVRTQPSSAADSPAMPRRAPQRVRYAASAGGRGGAPR